MQELPGRDEKEIDRLLVKPMDRTVLHCDCNSFFASVELLSLPELRDKPVAVCGNPEHRHGIILAKNEIAKKYGVATAETIWQAKRKCPNLVLIPPHHDRYSKYSKLINQIYERFTSQVEPFGIDESWLDTTGSIHLFGDGGMIADKIRETIKKELGLTISVGVSFNKVFAKLGSDYKKPDATTSITRDNFKEIIWPLPVGSLLFVGKVAADILAKHGVYTIGELASFDREHISYLLGKTGEMILDYANGRDDSPVAQIGERRELKSVGNGMTFRRNLISLSDIKMGLKVLADSVATRLRAHGLKCQTVQVIIKDPQLKSISRQRKLLRPTNRTKEISDTAVEIIRTAWKIGLPIRMLTVTGSQLVNENEATEQLDLFGDLKDKESERQEKLEHAIDKIRGKYGHSAISMGVIPEDNDLGIDVLQPDDE